MEEFLRLLKILQESQDKQELKQALSAISSMSDNEQISPAMWERFMIALEERFQRELDMPLLWELLMVIAGLFAPLSVVVTDRLATMLIFIADETTTLSQGNSIPIRLDFSGNLLVNALETGVKHQIAGTQQALVILATDFEVVGPITLALAGRAVLRVPQS